MSYIFYLANSILKFNLEIKDCATVYLAHKLLRCISKDFNNNLYLVTSLAVDMYYVFLVSKFLYLVTLYLY